MNLKLEARHVQGSPSPVSSRDLPGEANAQRTRAVGELIAAGIIAVMTFVSAAYASYRWHREMAQAYAALSQLDDHLLRDVGFARDGLTYAIAGAEDVAERPQLRLREAIVRVGRAIPFRRAGTTRTYGELGFSVRLTIGAIAVGLATLCAEALVVVPEKWENATRDFITQTTSMLPTQTPAALGIDARFGMEATEALEVEPMLVQTLLPLATVELLDPPSPDGVTIGPRGNGQDHARP